MRRQRPRCFRAPRYRRRMTSHMEAIAAPLPSLPGRVLEGPGGGASLPKEISWRGRRLDEGDGT
jgi:hypothetical protein